jgi:pilus assembly protein CpaF
MLQAMNTGHDGSMSTIHANTPRMALTRIENMLNMAGFSMPEKVTRSMISGAVHLIVQIARMRDGVRRITHITEIIGMEETTIITQDLFVFKFIGEGPDGKLMGEFEHTGVHPSFASKAKYFGVEKELLQAMNLRN